MNGAHGCTDSDAPTGAQCGKSGVIGKKHGRRVSVFENWSELSVFIKPQGIYKHLSSSGLAHNTREITVSTSDPKLISYFPRFALPQPVPKWLLTLILQLCWAQHRWIYLANRFIALVQVHQALAVITRALLKSKTYRDERQHTLMSPFSKPISISPS